MRRSRPIHSSGLMVFSGGFVSVHENRVFHKVFLAPRTGKVVFVCHWIFQCVNLFGADLFGVDELLHENLFRVDLLSAIRNYFVGVAFQVVSRSCGSVWGMLCFVQLVIFGGGVCFRS